ncbi:MAG: hypothetical protein A2X94_08885 [Bdellovibrionales bacterium GWB1_55_8]|nr:MAG: hypothetical protein A2X94_08885 [Bdellovibrionales bacterium GWB1_55_8]
MVQLSKFVGSGLFAVSAILSFSQSSYTHASPPRDSRVCAGAGIDGNVFAAGLGHDSFDSFYREPFGAVSTDQKFLKLRFRTCLRDVEQVRLRVWNAVERRETWVAFQREASSNVEVATRIRQDDQALGPVEFWSVDLPIPAKPTLLYYFFDVTDHGLTRYYVDDGLLAQRGGWGRFSPNWDDLNTYQITVYDRAFRTPDWLKGALVYQILPDRFRNGDRSNDPETGSGFIFGKKIRKLSWNQPLCDPRGPECPRESDSQFYGGDLQGVIDRLDYLRDLGVSAIYMNPIFLSSTNHRYDTQDWFGIDPELGTMETFTRLARESKARGIHLILDGVFNHGSADSPYFDVFHRWPGTGACEATDSQFRSWFHFPHFQHKPVDHSKPGTSYYCAGPDGTLTTYESWWGYFEHPVFNMAAPEIRNYFYGGGRDSVAPWWIRAGSSGWRLDVGGDIDQGASSPQNQFWEEFRATVKKIDSQAAIVGEEWGNASAWFLGREWDSAMNYRFRAGLLNWLSDGCAPGNGCSNGVFEDDDNNAASASGPIIPSNESQFDHHLKSIQQDYPSEVWHAMLNLLGSHDTQRVLFILKKISQGDERVARAKLRFASLFQLTFPGAPMVYYGDEAGVNSAGGWYGGRWTDDPYCRAVYPWEDEGLKPDQELIRNYAKLGKIRRSSNALSAGKYETLLTDNARRIFAFRRFHGSEQAWVFLNRGKSKSAVRIEVGNRLAQGTVLRDVLNGGTAVVRDGYLEAPDLEPLWGRIFVTEN